MWAKFKRKTQEFCCATPVNPVVNASTLMLSSLWVNFKRKTWEWRGILTIASSVTGFVIVLRMAGLFQMLELSMLDQFFRLRPLEKVDSRIVVVGIHESDLKKLGKWPVPDTVLADLLNKIKAQKPRAIGLDIYRDLPVEPGYQELVKVFESTPNLVGIQKVIGDDGEAGIPPPAPLGRLGQVGANDLPWDVDGKIRRGFLYLQGNDEKIVFSLGFQLSLLYLKSEKIEPRMKDEIRIQLGRVTFSPFSKYDGGYVGAADAGYQILLNYRGPQGAFPMVSLTEVLENQVDPKLMQDRIVLIGSTAKSLKDLLLTPYSSSLMGTPEPMVGVEVHANLVSQIISAALDERPLLKTWPELLEWLWIAGWSVIGAALICHWQDTEGLANISFLRTAGRTFFAGVCLFTIAYTSFLVSWWIPVIPPFFALAGATVVKTGYKLWENLILSYKKIEDYARTLEIKVEERTVELQHKNGQLELALEQLRAAQSQIVAQEKLAYLGSLAAGIAHEIRNPLNFVNNFASISGDLTQDIIQELENQSEYLESDSLEYLKEDLATLKESVEDIKQHGQRIDSIVQSMLMHAQGEVCQEVQTDLNALLTESIDLAFQSWRTKAEINITLQTHYDQSLSLLKLVPQDISKAFLNIINNAFYAMQLNSKEQETGFIPCLSVKTSDLENWAEIRIRDNGQGIPTDIVDKIFNPFFTTKPPGEGTGLGLSITYDTLVGKHRGEIEVDTSFGEYTEFIIRLPKV